MRAPRASGSSQVHAHGHGHAHAHADAHTHAHAHHVVTHAHAYHVHTHHYTSIHIHSRMHVVFHAHTSRLASSQTTNNNHVNYLQTNLMEAGPLMQTALDNLEARVDTM